MSDVHLVDVSLRDGNQSVWGATGFTTRMIRGVAPLLGPVGYRTLEVVSSTIMATAVRYHAEDPWERLDVLARSLPDTPLGFLTTGKRFISFHRTPEAIFELAFTLLARHGVRTMWVIDPMHDMDGARRTAALAKRCGFERVVGGVCYTTSPVHTDSYFGDKIAEFDRSDDLDAFYLKDPAGLLTPQRIATLIPLLQSSLTNHGLEELHSHATTGVSPLTLLDAADLGVRTLHTALGPLADGASHPQAQQLVANLRARGHTVDVDVAAMDRAGDYLMHQARIKRLRVSSPNRYDEAYYRHTIPGGVQSTTRRQLAEIRQEDKFDAVIEESVQVREDLGWPIVMTPFAQYIVTQATLNVVTGKRYERITDEIVDLVRGDFGPLPGKVDPDLRDRALSTRRGQQPIDDGSDVTIAGLRKKFGTAISDEELLMRALMPEDQVDRVYRRTTRPAAQGLGALIDALGSERSLHVTVPGGPRVELCRDGGN